MVLGVGHRALHTLSKPSTSELWSQSSFHFAFEARPTKSPRYPLIPSVTQTSLQLVMSLTLCLPSSRDYRPVPPDAAKIQSLYRKQDQYLPRHHFFHSSSTLATLAPLLSPQKQQRLTASLSRTIWPGLREEYREEYRVGYRGTPGEGAGFQFCRPSHCSRFSQTSPPGRFPTTLNVLKRPLPGLTIGSRFY